MNVNGIQPDSKILLTGAKGQVGSELLRLLRHRGAVWAPGRDELDLCDPQAIKEKIRLYKPDLIINPAAYTAVDAAETDIEEALAINQTAPKILSEEAHRIDVPLIHFSTDYVFDGAKHEAYTENDKTNPINIYGLSKCRGEEEIPKNHDKYFIFRVAWVYNKTRGNNFYRTVLHALQTKSEISVVNDEIGNPTSTNFIAASILNILEQVNLKDDSENRWGIYHLIEDEPMSRHQFACKILSDLNSGSEKFSVKINAISSMEYKTAALRPLNSTLSTGKVKKAFSLKG